MTTFDLEAQRDDEGDRFARNAQYLNAIIVQGGDNPRYAWKVTEQGPLWVTATPEQIRSLVWVHRCGESWLEWPEGKNLATVMPKGWTPDGD